MNKKIGGYNISSWLTIMFSIIILIIFTKVVINIDVLYKGIITFIHILMPFIVGFAIAYIINIPCCKIESLVKKINLTFVQKHARGISVLMSYIIVIIFVYLLLSFIVPAVIAGFLGFLASLPTYVDQFVSFLNLHGADINLDFQNLINDKFNPDKFTNLLNSLSVQDIMSYVSGFIKNIGTVVGYASYLLNAALAIIASIYFLLESQKIIAFIKKVIRAFSPRKVADIIFKYSASINDHFKTFFFCQIIDACILGTTATVGLSLIGVDYALALGPFLGVCNIVPYFGAIIATVITVIVVLLTSGFTKAIIVAIFLCVAQQLDGNVVQPKLLGSNLSLSPLLILISITIGGAYLGVVGMVIAVPIATVLKSMLFDLLKYMDERKEKQHFREYNKRI